MLQIRLGAEAPLAAGDATVGCADAAGGAHAADTWVHMVRIRYVDALRVVLRNVFLLATAMVECVTASKPLLHNITLTWPRKHYVPKTWSFAHRWVQCCWSFRAFVRDIRTVPRASLLRCSVQVHGLSACSVLRLKSSCARTQTRLSIKLSTLGSCCGADSLRSPSLIVPRCHAPLGSYTWFWAGSGSTDRHAPSYTATRGRTS